MAKNAPTKSRRGRRERLHRLVEALPDSELRTAIRVLEGLKAAAEYDTEPLTPEEQADADAGWQEYLEGKARPWEEVRAELTRG